MSLVEKPKGESFDNGALEANGQYERYAVLPTGDRKKFVRPYREAYKHVGVRPKYPLRDLTSEEEERYAGYHYFKYEIYPESESPVTGRFWTKKQLNSGCGAVTKMGTALAETYAADPTYYGATFCVGCGTHLPVNEFVWLADGEVVGS